MQRSSAAVLITVTVRCDISDGLLTKLQTVQNAAARRPIVTGTRKFDHITPVLHQLHWLPIRQRITFKLAMITFKCRHGLAPSYLADVCIPVSSVVGRWQLRSATLVVPRTLIINHLRLWRGSKSAKSGAQWTWPMGSDFVQLWLWYTSRATFTRTTIGRRDFAVSGQATCTSLPVELRTSSLSSQTFAKKKLKTHLFGC